MKTELPTRIDAIEYEETCGETILGNGIALVDEDGAVITRLNQWSMRERKIAQLWKAALPLLAWAKEACETERAYYDADDDRTPPSWLVELEGAIKLAEGGSNS